MPTNTITVLRFDGSVLSIGDLNSGTFVLNNLDSVTAIIEDDDLILDSGDNSDVPAPAFDGQAITYIGGGTASILGILLPQDVGVFTDGTSTYLYFPDGPPLLSPATFTLSLSASDTTEVCFAEGTQIDTPEGPRAVEDLAIGAHVTRSDGGTAVIRWIGRQTMRHRFSGRLQPVRIKSGALGSGLPHRDLVVTGAHGMILDGLVINASALVNGRTVDWVPAHEMPDQMTFYHVETENHEVILAEGAPTEIYIDCADRRNFDNYDQYLELYTFERIIPEMSRPRISAQRLVPETIKLRLGIEDGFSETNTPRSVSM